MTLLSMPPTRLLVADLIELTEEFERWPRVFRDPAVMDWPKSCGVSYGFVEQFVHPCSGSDSADSAFVYYEDFGKAHGRTR